MELQELKNIADQLNDVDQVTLHSLLSMNIAEEIKESGSLSLLLMATPATIVAILGDDEDCYDSALALVEALAATINASRFFKDVEIACDINDLTQP
jgi:hypothetical protein